MIQAIQVAWAEPNYPQYTHRYNIISDNLYNKVPINKSLYYRPDGFFKLYILVNFCLQL